MCHVRTTHFATCSCLQHTRILKPCPAAFSSLDFSCCGYRNETVVEILPSKVLYCRRCLGLMDRAGKEQYGSLRAETKEEGLGLQWLGLEVVRALDVLRRAEEEERRCLRAVWVLRMGRELWCVLCWSFFSSSSLLSFLAFIFSSLYSLASTPAHISFSHTRSSR